MLQSLTHGKLPSWSKWWSINAVPRNASQLSSASLRLVLLWSSLSTMTLTSAGILWDGVYLWCRWPHDSRRTHDLQHHPADERTQFGPRASVLQTQKDMNIKILRFVLRSQMSDVRLYHNPCDKLAIDQDLQRVRITVSWCTSKIKKISLARKCKKQFKLNHASNRLVHYVIKY